MLYGIIINFYLSLSCISTKAEQVKPKVYIETTVISYLTSRLSRDLRVAAYQQSTQDWWQDRRSAFELYASQLVIQEASRGDKEAAKLRLDKLKETTLLDATDEALVLAEILIQRNLIPQTVAEDAVHIAIATANAMDYLLTWNFKHIANATIRSRVEALCRSEGYEPPIICTPEELIEEL